VVSAVGDIPVLSTLFGGTTFGIGIFTAGLILSIMILPFISAVTRDVAGKPCPSYLKEALLRPWAPPAGEVMWRVCLPFCSTGVVGGAMLALGRRAGRKPWR